MDMILFETTSKIPGVDCGASMPAIKLHHMHTDLTDVTRFHPAVQSSPVQSMHI